MFRAILLRRLQSDMSNVTAFLEKHSYAIIATILLLGFVLTVLTIVYYQKSKKKTLYSYKNASLLGGSIFMIIFLAFLILSSFIKTANISPLQVFAANVSQSSSLFSIVLLPFMTVFFFFMGISNISLIRHEGKTVKNIVGSVLGFVLIAATVAGVFGWDVIYDNVVMALYAKGYTQVTVFDYAIPQFFTSLICYVECLLLGTIISSVKATRFKPNYDKDYIIILGCAISEDGKPLPLLRGRIDRALQFAREQFEKTGKMPKFVPSGGQGVDECISEAESMKNYLLTQGVTEDDILPENRSVNTLENMKFSKAIIDADGRGDKIIFSTTNYHVFRSGIYAKQAGVDAQGIGSKTKWYFWPNAFVREFVALLVNRKRGHIVNALILLLLSLACGVVNYAFINYF